MSRLHRGEADAVRPPGDDEGTMWLGPLEYSTVVQLVEGIVTARGVAGQVDVGRVADAAAGNPLRAIELARRALNGELPPATPIPLRDILWSRLQKASPSQRRVFFAASLLQRRCSLRLLAAAAHLPELATLDAAHELERLGLLAQESDAYVVTHDFTNAFVVEASGLAGRALLAGWAADALANEPLPPSADLANLYSIAGQQSAAFTHARRAVYDAATIGSSQEVNRLLGLALALSPDARSREQVESMLAAFGSGRKLLDAPPSTTQPADAAPQTPTEAPRQPAASPPASTTRVPTQRPRRPMLTPRLAALLIVGTIAISMAIVWAQSVTVTNSSRALRDTLIVVERGNEREPEALGFTGPLSDAGGGSFPLMRGQNTPAWTQTLQLPWIRPSVSSRGIVAVERMTETGTDVFLMTGPGAAPIPVAVGPGTDAILGWAPDGERLIIRRSRTLEDGAFDADLWVYAISGGVPLPGIAIDTSAGRSVEEEAVWSPDGTRIAWVALAGAAHQRDVFVSRADGSNTVNVTDHPGEDYHISWSSDGNLLAFTSDRDGNPDLFAIEFEGASRRLWRLTNTPDEEDHASFSPDHRFVAFQSTAGGDAGVYVMPALGGVATRLTPEGGQFSIAGWRGRAPTGYVDRFRIIGQSGARVGDSVLISIFASDREANTPSPDTIAVAVTDPTAADIRPVAGSNRYAVIPRRNGEVRVVASIPGWKYDTLTLQVGPVASARISDDFSTGLSAERWVLLGNPRPVVRSGSGVHSLYPNGDLQWQSGVLSRSVLSLMDGADASATFIAPFGGKAVAGATLTLALAQDGSIVDSTAPQVLPIASVTWDGESSRFTYSVGPQSKSDPVSVIGPGASHRVRILVTINGDISFLVDDRVRWTSSLRFLGPGSERRARVWLGGKATADWGAIQRLEVSRP